MKCLRLGCSDFKNYFLGITEYFAIWSVFVNWTNRFHFESVDFPGVLAGIAVVAESIDIIKG